MSFLLLLCFTEIPILNANSVDPDLGLHYLPMSSYGTLGKNGLNY